MRKKKITAKKILSKNKPEKKLTRFLMRRKGRGSNGRITTRHKGGGAKKLYRTIEFGQGKLNEPGKVISLEYDPFRSGFIALIEYPDMDRCYILAPHGLNVGDEIITAEKAEVKPGNRMKLKNIPVGTPVYNIEIERGKGGVLIRSAGTSAKILSQETDYVDLEMPSSEVRRVREECFATVGAVSYPEHRFVNRKKAGVIRHMGIRPTVRGSAMNPIDHPHGGGEGRTSIGLKHPKTPWGKPALGVKTRKKKKWTSKLIIQRRKKKNKK
ncbi:MAG: 50S ribosomal protein L2 [bacterium]